MNIDDIMMILTDVPNYQEFYTVDELTASSQKLAERFPDIVELIPTGFSRKGEAIQALRIGNGSRRALVFAMPHPNEPIGSMMLEFLSTRLAEDAALRQSLDCTWYLIKCIDPDGTRLNEGWFKGPFSITNYAQAYYRPPGYQQVEWTFPIDYKTHHFHNALPETQALMKLIEDLKPDFMYSLHNSGFGGVYAYLSHDVPSLYPDFYRLVDSQNLPIHLGEPEVPYLQEYSKAIYKMVTVVDDYDYLEKATGTDPAPLMNQGAGSWEYARRFCDPFFQICEMPYFFNPLINDEAPAGINRKELILQNVDQSRKTLKILQQAYEAIRAELTVFSPFREVVEHNLEFWKNYLNAQEAWAQSELKLETEATQAQKFDCQLGSRFYRLLDNGMFVRMVVAQIQTGGETPGLVKALEKAQEYFNQEASCLEADLNYEVIPIQKLVSVQLGAAFLGIEAAQRLSL